MKIYFICILCLSAYISYAAGSKRNELLEVIRQSNSKGLFPSGFQDEPLSVQFGVFLINVAEADHVKKEVEVDAWLIMKWRSPAASWSPSAFDDIAYMEVPREYVWVPDITAYNSVQRLVNDAPDTVVIASNGSTLWVPKVRFRALCDVDARYLASNVTCGIVFGSWIYNDNLFNISKIDDASVYLNHYFEGSRFGIIGVSSKKVTVRYPCCYGGTYSHILVNFSFKEKIPTPVMNGYVQGAISWR